MSDHVLISPEGDGDRRRHAHRECVLAAREAGRLPLESEWRATRPAAVAVAKAVGQGLNDLGVAPMLRHPGYTRERIAQVVTGSAR